MTGIPKSFVLLSRLLELAQLSFTLPVCFPKDIASVPATLEPEAYHDSMFWSDYDGRETLDSSSSVHPSFDLVSEERLSEFLEELNLTDRNSDLSDRESYGALRVPPLCTC